MGIVSFFADMAYEGARGINGPYLGLLGASGAIVGIVAGFGELLGFGLRYLSGRWADRTGKPWTVAIFGYGLNVLAVPILALTGSWQLAALFMLLERTGKAIRNPPRDAMLSQAGHTLGRGFTFGLHETLDRAGATIGPLIAAVVLARNGDYRFAYALLGAPALAALIALVAARRVNPTPRDLEPAAPEAAVKGFPRRYWLVVTAAAFLGAGFADFPLLAYHLGKTGALPAAIIPVLYSYANAVAGLSVLGMGQASDRLPPRVTMTFVLLPVLGAPLVLLGTSTTIWMGMALWGLGLAVVAGVFKPRIAAAVAPHRRGTAFGTFDAVFGIAWFLGSALLGVLYDANIAYAAYASAGLMLAAFPFLWLASTR